MAAFDWIRRPLSSGTGGRIHRNAQSLQYDDDCLLIGAPEQISFVKEGVLTNRHWIQYDRSLPGRGLSGGFIEELVKRSERGGPCLRFGLAIDRDVLIKREFFRPVVTRAFIRGPRGCSADLLNNPRFPEDHSGTVTEYRRVDENPVHELYPIERTEVMWSQRGGVKSVQIEELALPSPFRGMVDRVSNRFIHARWDIVSGAFQHLDGATKTYHAAGYKERLSCDIKRWGSRRCVYKKLFRIDAQLDVGEWSNLVAKYFSENELVVEYLESM